MDEFGADLNITASGLALLALKRRRGSEPGVLRSPW
jgi:hypothetical protein